LHTALAVATDFIESAGERVHTESILSAADLGVADLAEGFAGLADGSTVAGTLDLILAHATFAATRTTGRCMTNHVITVREGVHPRLTKGVELAHHSAQALSKTGV